MASFHKMYLFSSINKWLGLWPPPPTPLPKKTHLAEKKVLPTQNTTCIFFSCNTSGKNNQDATQVKNVYFPRHWKGAQRYGMTVNSSCSQYTNTQEIIIIKIQVWITFFTLLFIGYSWEWCSEIRARKRLRGSLSWSAGYRFSLQL